MSKYLINKKFMAEVNQTLKNHSGADLVDKINTTLKIERLPELFDHSFCVRTSTKLNAPFFKCTKTFTDLIEDIGNRHFDEACTFNLTNNVFTFV